MTHSFTICPAYHQFQLPNSINTWSMATDQSPHLHHLLSQRWYSINLDTNFSHRSLCNGYRITYISWTGDILLLLLLVLTCQISTPTFTTRFYVIYYCGWWCRGSTLLHMWWQGQIAYRTSWESWPAYGMRTYMDRESIEATDAVIRSSCMQIIGYHIQNPGNMIMYMLSVLILRIKPAVAPLCIDLLIYRCTLNDNSHFIQL